MIDPKFFDEVAARLSQIIPSNLQDLREDLEKNFKSALISLFAKLDLVTREEFDVQVKLLEKTRQKLELLEAKMKDLEKP